MFSGKCSQLPYDHRKTSPDITNSNFKIRRWHENFSFFFESGTVKIDLTFLTFPKYKDLDYSEWCCNVNLLQNCGAVLKRAWVINSASKQSRGQISLSITDVNWHNKQRSSNVIFLREYRWALRRIPRKVLQPVLREGGKLGEPWLAEFTFDLTKLRSVKSIRNALMPSSWGLCYEWFRGQNKPKLGYWVNFIILIEYWFYFGYIV